MSLWEFGWGDSGSVILISLGRGGIGVVGGKWGRG